MKRIRGMRRWVITMFMFLFVWMMSVSGQAAFTAATSNVVYPTVLTQGQQFAISGSVIANEKITKAVVSVYNSAGTYCIQQYKENPNAIVFNIKNADANMEFDKLPAGQYLYLVSVYNAAGTKYRAIKTKFTVSGTPVSGKITRSGVTYPTTLKVGQPFDMDGKLTATFPMKSIVFTIYKGSACVQRYTAAVNSNVYYIKNADSHLHFERLKAGTYYYRISAYNMSGTKIRVLDNQFKVVSATKSTIKITNPVPSKNVSLTKGYEYSIGGVISSTYNLATVSGTIYNAGGAAVYSKTVQPNARSFNLKGSLIDSSLHFESLPVGTYTYKVVAKDIKNKTATLINKKIVVKSSAPSPVPTPTKDIQLLYGVPSTDITLNRGSMYALGGTIVGKYKLTMVTATLKYSYGPTLVNKTVAVNSKAYILDESVIDASIPFEALSKGSYTLQISARDVNGLTVTVMSRNILIV